MGIASLCSKFLAQLLRHSGVCAATPPPHPSPKHPPGTYQLSSIIYRCQSTVARRLPCMTRCPREENLRCSILASWPHRAPPSPVVLFLSSSWGLMAVPCLFLPPCFLCPLFPPVSLIFSPFHSFSYFGLHSSFLPPTSFSPSSIKTSLGNKQSSPPSQLLNTPSVGLSKPSPWLFPEHTSYTTNTESPTCTRVHCG